MLVLNVLQSSPHKTNVNLTQWIDKQLEPCKNYNQKYFSYHLMLYIQSIFPQKKYNQYYRELQKYQRCYTEENGCGVLMHQHEYRRRSTQMSIHQWNRRLEGVLAIYLLKLHFIKIVKLFIQTRTMQGGWVRLYYIVSYIQ